MTQDKLTATITEGDLGDMAYYVVIFYDGIKIAQRRFSFHSSSALARAREWVKGHGVADEDVQDLS